MSKSTRICSSPGCTRRARNHKGPPVCIECSAEKVREAQRRYHGRDDSSYQKGWDEPVCVWCLVPMDQRQFEVLRPKRFCSDGCRHTYRNTRHSIRRAMERRCLCGGEPVNVKGSPVCATCRARKRERTRRNITLKPYGINVDDYDRMFAAQDGRCGICGSTDPGRPNFSVDHCHVGGHVRGLLCVKCNSLIGMADDDVARLRAAAAYIESVL